jgi:hypothetical protein
VSVALPAGLWSLRSLCFSAFRAGSLRALVLRPSSRSASGFVLACAFACPVRARRFAARWSARLGLSVSLRRVSGFWSVSVPVFWPGRSRGPGCLVSGRRPRFWVCGGLRGFLRGLRASSLAARCGGGAAGVWPGLVR